MRDVIKRRLAFVGLDMLAAGVGVVTVFLGLRLSGGVAFFDFVAAIDDNLLDTGVARDLTGEIFGVVALCGDFLLLPPLLVLALDEDDCLWLLLLLLWLLRWFELLLLLLLILTTDLA